MNRMILDRVLLQAREAVVRALQRDQRFTRNTVIIGGIEVPGGRRAIQD